MKVIAIDNFDRESPSYPDILISENLTEDEANFQADAMNKGKASASYFYRAVEDDYKLWKFEP